MEYINYIDTHVIEHENRIQENSKIKNALLNQGKSKNDKDNEFDSKELKIGIEVEKEHLDDPELSKEIAKDHLKEIPDYYTKLLTMEKLANKELPTIYKQILNRMSEFKSLNEINDIEIHKFANEINIEPEKLEEKIYKLLWLCKDLFKY